MRLSDYLRALAGAGAGVSGGDVRITRVDDGLQVGAGLTDSEGFCDLSVDGAHGNVLVTFRKGSTAFVQDSRNMPRTGGVWWSLLRTALKYTHGAGIIPAWAYGSDFATTGVGGVLRIATGAVMIDGVLACWYGQTSITPGADGDRALVAALSGSGIVQLADIAYSAIDATIHVPLRRYTVASGAISAITDISTPILRGIASRHPAVSNICRLTSGTTTNASGENSGLSCDLTLATGVTYDVRAKARVVSRARDGAIAINLAGSVGSYRSADGDRTQLLKASHHATGVVGAGAYAVTMYDRSDTLLVDWALQATYASTGSGTAPNLDTPTQVAIAPISGKPWIADSANNRAVRLNTDGTHDTLIAGVAVAGNKVTGVCCDSADNVYLLLATGGGVNGQLKKYNSSGILQWTSTSFSLSRHCYTDGTKVYCASASGIRIINCSDGSLPATTFLPLSNSPWGICLSGSNIVVTTNGATTPIEVYNGSGVLQASYGNGLLSSPRGIVITAAGQFAVANYGSDLVTFLSAAGALVTSFAQTDPDGIGLASGDVLWVSNNTDDTVAKWDEATTAFNWDAGVLAVLAIPRS